MTVRTATPDPAQFPAPNSWATWTPHRSPQFKNHKTLGMAKAAITNASRGRRQQPWWVYQLVDGMWVEYLHLPNGSDRTHELWTDPKHGPKPRPVSSLAVDKAIASIQRTMTQ